MLSDRFRAAVEQGDAHQAAEPFHENDLITELKVVLRPAPGLQAVGARMTVEFPRVGLRAP